MAMRIQVLKRAVEVVKTTWDGKERTRSGQWCTMEIDGLPSAFQVLNEQGQELAPGEYELDPKSFAVTNGRLTMPRAILRPVNAPAVK